MQSIHKNLAQGRWQELSLGEQLANIGSEVSRAARWLNVGDIVQKERSAERALELLDMTIAGMAASPARGEILRLREIFCDIFFGKQEYETSPQILQDYFLSFALVVRK